MRGSDKPLAFSIMDDRIMDESFFGFGRGAMSLSIIDDPLFGLVLAEGEDDLVLRLRLSAFCRRWSFILVKSVAEAKNWWLFVSTFVFASSPPKTRL